MSRPLLEGQIVDPQAEELVGLQREVAELTSRVGALESKLGRVEAIFGALKQVFNHASGASSGPTIPADSKWEIIKKRLTMKQGAVIDLLSAQGQMTVSQLAAATKSSNGAMRQMVDKLRSQGLVEKNGSHVSLRG